MSLTVEIRTRGEFNRVDLCEMHKLRAKIFRDRMGWDVAVLSGMEIDGYDAIEPHYMMMHEAGGVLRGCWRLLPTEGPYMLKDTFPQLLHGAPPPADPKVWEISRFAIATDARQVYGFSDIAIRSIEEVIDHGHRNGIDTYVMATTTAIERMLRRAGVVLDRFGPPMRVGVETAVALSVDIKASFDALDCANMIRPR